MEMIRTVQAQSKQFLSGLANILIEQLLACQINQECFWGLGDILCVGSMEKLCLFLEFH